MALRRDEHAIYAATSRRLTFSGQPSIVIPAGAVAVSDALDFAVPAAADLAISVYLPDGNRARDVPRRNDEDFLRHRSPAIS